MSSIIHNILYIFNSVYESRTGHFLVKIGKYQVKMTGQNMDELYISVSIFQCILQLGSQESLSSLPLSLVLDVLPIGLGTYKTEINNSTQ